jgi:hypothetical protein
MTKEFRPRVKRCTHCPDLNKSKATVESIGDCKRFPWEIGKVGRTQAICDDRLTGDIPRADEHPTLGEDE